MEYRQVVGTTVYKTSDNEIWQSESQANFEQLKLDFIKWMSDGGEVCFSYNSQNDGHAREVYDFICSNKTEIREFLNEYDRRAADA